MANAPTESSTDFLVIGSGIAGLRAAIELSKAGKKVTIITKSGLTDSNTYYAQGGIAAVDPARVESGSDSFDSHYNNTLTAGDGLCDPKVVRTFVDRAYDDTIQFLIDRGTMFSETDKGNYKYILHQEGGHDRERIYCVGDYTGKAVEETLAEAVKNDPNIKLFENHTALNLITANNLLNIQGARDRCLGAYVLDRETGEVKTLNAKKVFLATGGAGRVFKYTSNPENATGDGIAMAYRAGARIANMEFFQFHPTVLYDPNPEDPSEQRFLLTEALRGEAMGGILTTARNSLEDFVKKYDPRGSHGTRDIVARAIDTEMKSSGLKHVWLNATPDVTGKTAEFIIKHYPKIYERCMSKGIDMTKEPIPVLPAAHYTCGGVLVDEFGQTDINGLYAIGEVSCTGLMGANRLASNSLSEGALYGKLAVEHALATLDISADYGLILPQWRTGSVDTKVDLATLNQFWDTTRNTMTNLCGIDRNEQRLMLASTTMNALVSSADEIYKSFYPNHEIIELRNLTLVGKLIAESALARKESRGGHFRSDYPNRNDEQYKRYTIAQKDVGILL